MSFDNPQQMGVIDQLLFCVFVYVCVSPRIQTATVL